MRKKAPSFRLQIQNVHGKYCNFKFPEVTSKSTQAEIKKRLDSLVFETKTFGLSKSNQTWITKQNKQMKRRLIRLGVVEADDNLITPKISEFVRRMTKTQPGKWTTYKLQDAQKKLVQFFGDRRLNNINKGQAEEFFNWLINKETGLGLEEFSTARRTLGYCRQIWNKAMKLDIVDSNPWKQDSLKVTVRPNKEKWHYINKEITKQLYGAIPEGEYKLRFVLLRFAGLRGPSEINALRWADVDFENGDLIIRASKTKRTNTRGVRCLPIFPEVLAELLKQKNRNPDANPEDPVLKKISHRTLYSTVGKWIGKIGHKGWPDRLVNFRRSAATDKHLEGYPSHILNAWFGHTEIVSMTHYRMETDEIRERARNQDSLFASGGDADV